VSEAVGAKGSLDAKLVDARIFYATIAVTTLAGTALHAVGIDPVKALYWAAVVNGVLAAPLMAVMMLIVRNPRAMGRLTLSRGATLLGWGATLVMFAATALFFAFAF
jgi:Mn2+/Fe2+ NRAMP family transporter